jgi:hypothetical protein
LWKPKNPFDGLTSRDVEVAQKVAQGGVYRADAQAKEWFGYALADHLKINVRHGAENKPADIVRLKQIIKTWIKNNVLAIEEREDDQRHSRKFIVPGSAARNGNGYAADDDPF